MKKNSILKNIKSTWQLHILVLIPFIFIIIFAYVPMTGVILSWKKYISTKGIYFSPWIGWDNFNNLFNRPGFPPALWNTFFIAMLKIVIGFPIPIIVALLLNEVRKKFFKKTIQTMIYLPYFLSWAILGGIFLDIFAQDGIINKIIIDLGGSSISWLGEKTPFISLLVASDVWKNFGYNTIVYLAALTGIDASLYEAAKVDGAGRWKQTLYITIPGIVPIAILLGILSLGNVLNAGFEQIFVLINPTVENAGQIIDTLVYQIIYTDRNFGIATALTFFKSVIAMIFIFSGWYFAKKYSDYRIF